jgi:hypothetical protein
MSSESKGSPANAELLRAAELSLRDSVLEHGLQHPQSLAKLEQYAGLLRHFGKIDQAVDLENQIKGIKARTASTNQQQQPAESKQSVQAIKPAAIAEQALPVETDRSLFSARGRHIATETEGCLYTPTGKFIGHWNEALAAYINRDGYYLGLVLDENRLVRESNWRFNHMNFGHPPKDVDRPGWRRQPDMSPFLLPRGFEEVKMLEDQ